MVSCEKEEKNLCGWERCAYLGSLLRASLSLRERGSSDLLAGLGRLSLRKEDISKAFKPKRVFSEL